jgi:hypothetical protein
MRLDDRYSLQAGVFSRDPERSRAFGQTLHIAPDRLYADFAEMAKAEAQWPDGVEVVAITPSSPGERASSQNRPSSVNRLYATG